MLRSLRLTGLLAPLCLVLTLSSPAAADTQLVTPSTSAVISNPIPNSTGSDVFQVSVVQVGLAHQLQFERRLEHADGSVAAAVSFRAAVYDGPLVCTNVPAASMVTAPDVDFDLVKNSHSVTWPTSPADESLFGGVAAVDSPRYMVLPTWSENHERCTVCVGFLPGGCFMIGVYCQDRFGNIWTCLEITICPGEDPVIREFDCEPPIAQSEIEYTLRDVSGGATP